VADIVQGADVGMIQRRNAAGLAIEPLAEGRIVSKVPRQDLDGTVRSSRVSRAR